MPVAMQIAFKCPLYDFSMEQNAFAPSGSKVLSVI